MHQVPVGRSIARAYGFLSGRILTVLELSWIAALFFIVLRKALLGLGPVPHDLAAHWSAALMHLGGLLAAVLLLCAIAVPLTRAALGGTMEWSLAHFVIGARELRLFAALVRLYLILIALTVVCVAAVIGVGMGTKMALAQWPVLASTGLPVETIMRALAVIAAAAVMIYVSVRLSFLLYAIAVAEPRASLKRSWELAKGNVLRMFAIALAIIIPVYALFLAVEYALMGRALVDAIQAVIATTWPLNEAPLHTLLAAHGWAVATAAGVMVVLLTALEAAASATVYRGLLGLDVAEAPEMLEDAVVVEAAQETPAEEYAEAVELHEMHADDSHGDASHAEHGEEVQEEEAGHDAPAEDAHGHEDHDHGDQAHESPAEEGHAAEHDTTAHAAEADADAHGQIHGQEAHDEEPHAEDSHGEADHADAGAEQHDAPAEGDAAAAEHHDVHAARAPAEDAHAEEGHGEEGHGEEAPAETLQAEAPPAEEVHGDAGHDEAHTAEAGEADHETHRELEHA